MHAGQGPAGEGQKAFARAQRQQQLRRLDAQGRRGGLGDVMQQQPATLGRDHRLAAEPAQARMVLERRQGLGPARRHTLQRS